MIDLLTGLLLGTSTCMALWALVLTIVNRPTNLAVFAGLGVVELLLVVQVVVSAVMLARGSGGDVDGVLFFGYLLTALIIVPAAGFWAFAETGRWGAGVLVAGCLTTAIMVVRMVQIWQG